jgi:hypothetical protein
MLYRLEAAAAAGGGGGGGDGSLTTLRVRGPRQTGAATCQAPSSGVGRLGAVNRDWTTPETYHYYQQLKQLDTV